MRCPIFSIAPLFVALILIGGAGAAETPPITVVIDAGHGGADYGARSPSGVLEKDVVLAVSRRIAVELEARGMRVVQTRTEDRFLTLPERTEIANRVNADLYLSIHANASPDAGAHGAETYFLSLDASDEEARRVALVENAVFDQSSAAIDSGDVVGSILGDLIRTDQLRRSSALAASVQRQLERRTGRGRGVKQAPFVVLMGVNMPAALIEIGFLTHPREGWALQQRGRQRAIARAVADGLEALPVERDAEEESP